MKKLGALLTLFTVSSFGAAVQAAEMVETPAIYDWTGFYVGGNLGWAFGGSDRVGLKSNLGYFLEDEGKLKLDGGFGGDQIGADWQTGSFVFGAVADVEFSGTFADTHRTHSADGVFLSKEYASDDIDWWGTLRGRAGWAFDNLLIYGTGGLAWADVDYDIRGHNSVGLTFDDEKHTTRIGWTAGGGLAWGIDEHWSIGAEYLYVNLGKYSVDAHIFDPAGDKTGEVFTTQATPDFHSVKGFVNFRF